MTPIDSTVWQLPSFRFIYSSLKVQNRNSSALRLSPWSHNAEMPDAISHSVWLQFPSTAHSRVLPKKLSGPYLLKKFPTFHGTRKFITTFTTASHLSPSWPKSIQSMPPSHFLNNHFNIIIPFTYRSSEESPTFRPPHKTLYAHLPAPVRATCSAHFILLNFITRTIFGEQYIS